MKEKESRTKNLRGESEDESKVGKGEEKSAYLSTGDALCHLKYL